MASEQRTHEIAQAMRDAIRANRVAVSCDERVSEADAAQLLGLHPGTLKNLRHQGTGPPAYRIPVAGSRISYRVDDLAAWVEARRH
ncbi:hypothetical protein C0099_08575 [Pseudazoarcus pumilus]|uniref:Helix-turn-helix domain-containing protein n=2 Tax=Pseudazoarcus pumilus TaxID=2067960 RepID=A0A2I6S6U9_9RHOO|nr:hypothetical protein C0099_08575 [Pseudazoarcus pumilus]